MFCKNVVEPTRHLHVQVTITMLNTINRFQGMKQINEAGRCFMKREQQLQMKRPRGLRNTRCGASSQADKCEAMGHGPRVNPPLNSPSSSINCFTRALAVALARAQER